MDVPESLILFILFIYSLLIFPSPSYFFFVTSIGPIIFGFLFRLIYKVPCCFHLIQSSINLGTSLYVYFSKAKSWHVRYYLLPRLTWRQHPSCLEQRVLGSVSIPKVEWHCITHSGIFEAIPACMASSGICNVGRLLSHVIISDPTVAISN
ncbi:hypothetical protein F4775DRAFT_564704 [Biscogniauxia sp. FL1348]|nr:hypothetical protein F4775DRAFT_564704 [Biscogniauxia sp. FL1348]